jgi:hypothetical protein
MNIICSNCKLPKDENEYHFRNTKKNIRHYVCKECRKKYHRDHYLDNKKLYKSKAVVWSKTNKKRNFKKIISYLSEHPCVDCGESDIVVLEFDHIKDKKMNISVMLKYHSWSNIIKEINKCEVRCANCHRRKTAKQQRWFKSFI